MIITAVTSKWTSCEMLRSWTESATQEIHGDAGKSCFHCIKVFILINLHFDTLSLMKAANLLYSVYHRHNSSTTSPSTTTHVQLHRIKYVTHLYLIPPSLNNFWPSPRHQSDPTHFRDSRINQQYLPDRCISHIRQQF